MSRIKPGNIGPLKIHVANDSFCLKIIDKNGKYYYIKSSKDKTMKLNEIIKDKVKELDKEIEKSINKFAEETGLKVAFVRLMKTIDAFGNTTYMVVTDVEIE